MHNRKDYPKLYKKNSAGTKILTYHISILDNGDEEPALQTTVTGDLSGGKEKVAEKLIKGNKRQEPFERAVSLADTVFSKKQRLGYHLSEEEAQNASTPLTAMLASTLDPKEILDMSQRDFPLYMSEKLNGLRGTYHADTNKIMSRELKEYDKFDGLHEALRDICRSEIPFLDFELKSSHEAPINEQVSMVKHGDSRVVAYIFDMPSLDKEPFSQRLQWMMALDKVNKSPYIEVIPTHVAKTPQELLDFYERMVYEGAEGVMIRPMDSVYKWNNKTSRGKELQKIKPLLSAEFKITGIGCERRIIDGVNIELIDFLCETHNGKETFKVTPASFGVELRKTMYTSFRRGEIVVDELPLLSCDFREWTAKLKPFHIKFAYLRYEM